MLFLLEITEGVGILLEWRYEYNTKKCWIQGTVILHMSKNLPHYHSRCQILNLMFSGLCIIVIVEEWKTNLMSLAVFFHFLCTQRVSDINISIIRSLRLCCWITTLVVLFSVHCVLEIWCGWVWVVSTLQANKTTDVIIQQHSRKLLMMDILISETCWVHKKWNKTASDIKLVFYSSDFKIYYCNVCMHPAQAIHCTTVQPVFNWHPICSEHWMHLKMHPCTHCSTWAVRVMWNTSGDSLRGNHDGHQPEKRKRWE